MTPSNAEIDRLGDRFKADPSDIENLSDLFRFCLDVKRRTESVLVKIRETTGLDVTPRDGKSFTSILEKLRRRSVKLSAMQDIEGCRIIVDSPVEQDVLAFRLRSRFADAAVYDRRKNDGYRALHLVVRKNHARYEIQIRTLLQHNWAQVSENLAARYGQELKYGQPGTTPEARAAVEHLNEISGAIELFERIETDIWNVNAGTIFGPVDEVVSGIELFLENHDLGPFEEDPKSAAIWAFEANRRLLEFKDMWREELIALLESGESE